MSLTESATSASAEDPKIAASLRADCEALRNDLEQATELASDFQRQLAAKSNEFAHLKSVSEKTQQDLEQLQIGLVTIREERNHLSSEGLRAAALDRRLALVTADRDRLHAEVEVLRQGTTGDSAELARRLLESEAKVAQLATEIESLQQRLAFVATPAPAAPAAPSAPAAPTISPEIKAVVSKMARAVDELTRLIESSAKASNGKQGGAAKPARYERIEVPEEPDESLEISFGS